MMFEIFMGDDGLMRFVICGELDVVSVLEFRLEFDGLVNKCLCWVEVDLLCF